MATKKTQKTKEAKNAEATEIADALAELGFKFIWNTGGGCESYMMPAEKRGKGPTSGSGRYFLISDEGCGLPVEWSREAMIGYYDDKEEELEILDTFDTTDLMVRALGGRELEVMIDLALSGVSEDPNWSVVDVQRSKVTIIGHPSASLLYGLSRRGMAFRLTSQEKWDKSQRRRKASATKVSRSKNPVISWGQPEVSASSSDGKLTLRFKRFRDPRSRDMIYRAVHEGHVYAVGGRPSDESWWLERDGRREGWVKDHGWMTTMSIAADIAQARDGSASIRKVKNRVLK